MRSVPSFLGSLKSGSARKRRERFNVQFWSGSIVVALFVALASKYTCSTSDLSSCMMAWKPFNPKISPALLLI